MKTRMVPSEAIVDPSGQNQCRYGSVNSDSSHAFGALAVPPRRSWKQLPVCTSAALWISVRWPEALATKAS
jgi:hypothetical protein